MDLEKARHSPPPVHHRFPTTEDHSSTEAEGKHVAAPTTREWRSARKKPILPVPLVAMARNRPQGLAGKRRRSVSSWRRPLRALDEEAVAEKAAHNWRICKLLFWCCTMTTVVMVAGFLWWGRSYIEDTMLNDALTQRMKTGRGWFGAKMRAEFDDMIQLRELHQRSVPSAKDRDRRLIVVGDVHGCIDELNALLARVAFDAANDHLVFTGNLIFQGPNSAAVVDLAIQHNASCVRGDHEDRVLLLHRDLFSHPLTVPVDAAVDSSDISIEDASHHHSPSALSSTLTKASSFKERHTSPHRALAASLTSAHIRYLYGCPLILTTPHLPAAPHRIAIVHAGLAPGVPLAQQDPSTLLTMSSVDLASLTPLPPDPLVPSLVSPAGDARKGAWGRRPRTNVPWRKLWDRWQALRPSNERLAVMYGHDAPAGVVAGSWTWGLDGGCWMGGELAAAVVTWQGVQIERVPCRDWRPRTMEQLGAG